MSVAFWWGALASMSLFVGQALARPLREAHRATGLITGFGAGALVSAISYELVPKASLSDAVRVGIGMFIGALVYYLGDRLLDRRGAGSRHEIRPRVDRSSGAAMFVGAVLDTVPETFILGMGLGVGGSISMAFLIAILVSNVPQGVAATAGLIRAGYGHGLIAFLYTSLTLVAGLSAMLGFSFAGMVPEGLDLKAFAAGALLMMLADSMFPEAYANGGPAVGFLTVLGFLFAAAISVA